MARILKPEEVKRVKRGRKAKHDPALDEALKLAAKNADQWVILDTEVGPVDTTTKGTVASRIRGHFERASLPGKVEVAWTPPEKGKSTPQVRVVTESK